MRENKKELKNTYNEDDAMEIVDIEFQELESWMKKEIRSLKDYSYDIVDCLKVNRMKSNEEEEI